jgi:hypothetical protein
MDPRKSTVAAIAYLQELHQMFGDWTTALAAYNCGETRVMNRIRTQRINYLDNFWDLYEKLPNETARYVPRLLAVLHIVKDPAAHGMELPPLDDELETEEIAIHRSRFSSRGWRCVSGVDPSTNAGDECRIAPRHNARCASHLEGAGREWGKACWP